MNFSARRSPASRSSAGHRLRWLRCDLRSNRAAAARRPTATRPRSMSIGARPIGALVGAEHAARERAETLGTSDGTPGQVLPLRFSPVLPLVDAERLEVEGSGLRSLAAMDRGRIVRGLHARRPPLQARSHQRPARAGAGGAPARRRLDPVRRDPLAGSRPADERLPPRRRAPRKCRARHADDAAQRDPRGRLRDQPAARLRRRRSRVAGLGAAARRDGDPHQVPSGHGGGLRVPRRRGVVARRSHDLRRPGRAHRPDQGPRPSPRRSGRSQAHVSKS